MQGEHQEEFSVSGEEVLKVVRRLIAEGNARKIIIKNDQGDVVVEIPLAIGAAGVLIAPALAAVGAVAALLTHCTIVVVKKTKSSETDRDQGRV